MQMPPLPGLTTNIRPVAVTNVPIQILFANADRRMYLVQNQSTTDSIQVTSTQTGVGGQIIPPSGAKIIDTQNASELWAVDTTGAGPALVSVEEIKGYTPWELYMLQCLCEISETLKGLRRG